MSCAKVIKPSSPFHPPLPLIISGLLWLLVVFEGQESESESLARLTETTTSLLPIGGFSWDDSSSSTETNRMIDVNEHPGRKKMDIQSTNMLMYLVPGCERYPVHPAVEESPLQTAGQRRHWIKAQITQISLLCPAYEICFLDRT